MQHNATTSSDVIPSSPPAPRTSSRPRHYQYPSPKATHKRKEKRNPSVTPRRFGRFFTPRSSLSLPTSDHRRILSSLNSSVVNRQPISPQSLVGDPLDSDPICSSPTERLADEGGKRRWADQSDPVIKRRRGLFTDGMPPPQLNLEGLRGPQHDGGIEPASSQESLEDRRKATLNHFFKASRGGVCRVQEKSKTAVSDVLPAESQTNSTLQGYEPKPIRKFRNRGFEAQLLDREHGFSSHAGRQYLATPACDPRAETASFYSKSSDVHHCAAYTGHGNTIPFSLASCNTAPVTAIGDEQGFVRLFNTTETDHTVESKVNVHIKAHDNAIMDLSFSDDDMRLATACGDRTGKILDVVSQTVAVELGGGHWDSLRQISFQPGQANGNMLASSDRAGRVQIWDLRCSTMPINIFSTAGGLGTTPRDTRLSPLAAKTVNTIDNAHERTVHGNTSSVSVTAIQWMPPGREHLLLTASEANASVKLWDTRYIRPRRQAEETPLAVTPEPATHAWRSYGITSLALGADAARLYAVCKDSTVYACSTAHLLLGHAPELVHGAVKRKPAGSEGLGPLYGFKHDSFRAQSFYVKCAIRPARGQLPELLAVGSSDGCAMLFPTDERYLHSTLSQRAHVLGGATVNTAPTPSQSFSSTPSGASPSSSPIPISRSGTALVRGHAREVTTLSWSHEGKLVTASDDYVVRQWQQDAGRARHLRQVGEFGGERHMAGWADVGDDWDVEDDEG